MKKFLKSSLSVILAITIIFSSAIVGFSEVGFSNVFAIKLRAASVNDLTFSLNFTGTSYWVSDCSAYATGEIVIPDTYQGLPVTSIAYAAFSDCTRLTSITIPISVTSIDYEAFRGCSNLKSIIIPNGVTSIAYATFAECKNLTSITIPDTVTTIDSWAFSGCTSLSSIAIPDSVNRIDSNAFYGCSALESIIIPKTLKKIEDLTFADCSNLTSVTIPSSVEIIGASVFSGCTSLYSITIPNGVTTIGERAFCDCTHLRSIKFSNSVTTIGEKAFWGCLRLESITIPESVKKIGSYAFSDCTSLKSIILPDTLKRVGYKAFCHTAYYANESNWENGVLYIGNHLIEAKPQITGNYTIKVKTKSISPYAFSGCSGLNSVVIPDSVIAIGNYAFADCYNLVKVEWNAKNVADFTMNSEVFRSAGTSKAGIRFIFGDSVERIPSYLCYTYYVPHVKSVVFGDNIKSVGVGAFELCSGLTSVYITNLANWCNIVFEDYSSNPLCVAKKLYLNNKLLTDITIPDNITSIGNYAFYNCSNITSVTLGDNVTSIGSSAFDTCSSLVAVNIPDSVESIGAYAFYDCVKLESVDIGNGVTSIGIAAFYNCAEITSVTIGKNVKSINKAAFSGCSNLISVTIPDNVTSIGNEIFKNCTSLTSVVLGNGVTKINTRTFANCSKLKSVVIQVGLTDIEDEAFDNCSSLKYIFYSGSQEQWWNVIIGVGNLQLDKANIHYNATNHTFENWIIDNEATPNATGSKHAECSECGLYITEVIPQLKPATTKLSKVANTASGVKFTWGAVDGADSYIVYRRAYNSKTKAWSGWVRIADGVTSTSYLDKTAKSGTYYRYTVKAVNEAGNSGYDANGLKTYFLSTPKATTANSNSGVTVKWGKVSGATGYIVYRKTGNGKWQNLGKTTSTSFTDKTAKAGVTYKYTVKAYYGSYVSAYNTNGYAVRRLLTPTLKSVTSAKAGVTFKWNKVTGATGYIVYRKTGNGSWQNLGKTTGVSFTDKTAKKGVTYTYTVKAYYGTSNSAYNTKGLTVKDKY